MNPRHKRTLTGAELAINAELAARRGHTAGTWRTGDAFATVFGPPNGTPSPETIATVRKAANARFIVRACNAHDELLAALQTYELWFRGGQNPSVLSDAHEFARAAIAKAVQS